MKFTRSILAAAIAIASAQAAFAQDDKAAATTKPTTQAAGPVDFRKLKEVLPENLAGLKRDEATGERTGFGEMKFSSARATYVNDKEKDDAPRIDLQILDYGTNKQMVEGLALWTKMEIDTESDGGYQKTVKVQEQPAMEQFQNEGKTGQLQLLVADRFFVTLNTTNLPVEQFKKIGEELKLKDLAALGK
jgi:hypothetical protein